MADFTIADVLAWARTKPAGKHYSYCDPGNCAIAQFGIETGREHLVGLEPDAIPLGLATALNPWAMPRMTGSTFGQLVARLETLCPTTPVPQSEWAAIDAYLTDIDAVSADKLAPAHIQPHTV